MRIIPGDPAAPRPWIIVTGTHQLRLRLASTTRRVRAGTPLVPTAAGWVACPPDARPWAFSAEYKMPGDECMAWREVTIDTGHVLGPPGTRLKLADLGDDGSLTLEPDPNGPHVVLWDSHVLFTTFWPSITPEQLAALLVPPEPEAAPVEDYLNRPDLLGE